MTIVRLSETQAELMCGLELPTVLSSDMDEAAWFGITDRLGEELQLHGIDATGDGLNGRGETCRQVLEAMARAED